MIGAMQLSDKAKSLEDAAKRGQEAFIKENHLPIMREYERISEGILTWIGGSAAADTEILEFSPKDEAKSQEDVLEFAPEAESADDDEVLEFAPEEDS